MRTPRPLNRLALAAGLMAVVAGCQPRPAASPVPGGAPADAGGRVYVAGQDAGTVTVLDAESHDVLATVDLEALGYGANAKPHHVVVEPDGSHWYVSLIGANRVLKLDRQNRVVGEAELAVPGMLALAPESDRLYVGRSMSAVNPPSTIAIVDRESMTADELSVFFPRPHAMAVHPSGDWVYSASLAQNSMAVVEPAEEDVDVRALAPPEGGTGVHTLVQWAVSPDGRTLVGTGEMSGELLVFDLTDPAEPRLRTQVAVGARPWHPVFSPDGSEVWFANKGANSVTMVDTRTWSVAAVVRGEGLSEPHGTAISGDGRWVFVSSNNLKGGYPGGVGTLTVIDRATHEIVEVVPVGANAAGVGADAGR